MTDQLQNRKEPMKTWTWNDQFENDIWYIENCSFLVDVKMMTAMAKEAIYGSDYRAGDTRREFDRSAPEQKGSKTEG